MFMELITSNIVIYIWYH